MVKKILILFIFVSVSYSGDFITKREYGESLYKNPRSIGCDKCHGKDGKGALISRFTNVKGKKQKLIAPNIRHLSVRDLKKGLLKHSSFVPRYFLTNKELQSISKFLQGKK